MLRSRELEINARDPASSRTDRGIRNVRNTGGRRLAGRRPEGEVELEKLQNERNELGQERENAAAMLNALRGVPAGRIVGRVAEPPLVKVALSVEDLTADALANRPEILGMNEQLAMNRVDATATDREKLPDLMVRGTYKKMTEGTDQWAAMFSINVPIAPWSAGKYSGKSEERALAARATEQSLADMRYMVQAKCAMHGKDIGAVGRTGAVQGVHPPRAEQSLRSDLTAFKTNGVDFLSLLESFRMLQMLKWKRPCSSANISQTLRSLKELWGGICNDFHEIHHSVVCCCAHAHRRWMHSWNLRVHPIRAGHRRGPARGGYVVHVRCIPRLRSDKPGACPICGMALVKRRDEPERTAAEAVSSGH